MVMIDIDTIHVLDDIIPKAYQDDIEALLLRGTKWHFIEDVALGSYAEKVKTPGFTYTFFEESMKNSDVDRTMCYATMPIVHSALDRISYAEKYCPLRMRSFMHLPLHENFKCEHNNPHTDSRINHFVVLYYVNDTDGDTFMFDQLAGDDTSSFTVYKRITPKKGRAIIFNGSRYHASSTPTIAQRCVINFTMTNLKI